jgi:hypothetical protein
MACAVDGFGESSTVDPVDWRLEQGSVMNVIEDSRIEDKLIARTNSRSERTREYSSRREGSHTIFKLCSLAAIQ